MEKVVILVIIPDYKNAEEVLIWEKNVYNAYLNYDKWPLVEQHTTIEERWAIGFVVWNKLIEYFNMINSVSVFFIRTDYRLNVPYEIKDNIISIQFGNHRHGHIIYKTIKSLNILKNKFDYYIRGNVNTIIDINMLKKFVTTLPKKNVFTSPFWEGGSYSYGYFMLFTNDIANYLLEYPAHEQWWREDTPDDSELAEVILKKYNYYIIKGGDIPHKKMNTINSVGIKFAWHGKDGFSSEVIINAIKKSSASIFLYRIKDITDNKYLEVYKFLIKHLWNKVVKNMFSSMIIYDTCGHQVPHLDYERDEQLLAARYIDSEDVVLELGARYGSVSCIINKIVNNKLSHVAVEPDSTVWKALERNRKINNCLFNIFYGIISNKKYDLKLMGYGSCIDVSNTITNKESINTENISLEKLEDKFGIKFDVLVADCEGFLEVFLDENPILYTQLRKIIFECDRAAVCNYNKIKCKLVENNFKLIENGFQCVYIK
jgi:FkbM family methyltransferase